MACLMALPAEILPLAHLPEPPSRTISVVVQLPSPSNCLRIASTRAATLVSTQLDSIVPQVTLRQLCLLDLPPLRRYLSLGFRRLQYLLLLEALWCPSPESREALFLTAHLCQSLPFLFLHRPLESVLQLWVQLHRPLVLQAG